MVHAAADLAQFVQRRELMAYEQRLARAAYAYGVDLRRSRWLDNSTLGEPIIRSVDRRWGRLIADLGADTLLGPDEPTPMALMEEIVRIVKLLRAPLPTVRLLNETARGQWPAVTPLGPTKGCMHWLVLDGAALLARPPRERAFLLGSGLGHLQCDHGPLFAAHLLAHRGGWGLQIVRKLLSPWGKVAMFSADRAGLLAAGELEPALSALVLSSDPLAPWLPRQPSVAVREEALREFDRSTVVVRLRALMAQRQREIDPEPVVEEDADDDEVPEPSKVIESIDDALEGAWSVARCDQRLTRRLRLF